MTTPTPTVEPLRFTCPNCGAQTEFAPGTTSLRCSKCGHEESIAPGSDTTVDEHSYDAWASLPPKPVATIGKQVLQCQNCGATTETDMLADTCRFCHGPLVALTEPPGVIVPEAVVPFGIDKDRANDAFRRWVRSRHFAPNALKRVGTTSEIGGTYLPHWTFDAHTETDYRGQRGEHYWVTVSVPVPDGKGGTRMETRQEQRTRWYPASGHVARSFDDVLVPATHRLPPERLEKMGPWQLKDAAAFQPQFLAGFEALRYDVDPDAGIVSARAEMEDSIRGECRQDIGGDEQRVESINVSYTNNMFKLLLLPLWIASYLYAGKTFQVLVNANTGEVIGDRPFSKLKIALAVLAALVVIAGAITLYLLSRRS